MARRDLGGTAATSALAGAGVEFTVHSYDHHPGVPSYGLEAAQALGVEASRVLKTLLVDTGGRARRGHRAGRPLARPQGDGRRPRGQEGGHGRPSGGGAVQRVRRRRHLPRRTAAAAADRPRRRGSRRQHHPRLGWPARARTRAVPGRPGHPSRRDGRPIARSAPLLLPGGREHHRRPGRHVGDGADGGDAAPRDRSERPCAP